MSHELDPSDRSIDQEMTPDENDSHGDYEVGYGKPPKETQFKPGKSGNPAGKTKGSKSFKTIVRTALAEKVKVRTANGVKKLSKLEALVQKTISDALNGNQRATQQLMVMLKSAGLEEELAERLHTASADQLAQEDQAILDRYLHSAMESK